MSEHVADSEHARDAVKAPPVRDDRWGDAGVELPNSLLVHLADVHGEPEGKNDGKAPAPPRVVEVKQQLTPGGVLQDPADAKDDAPQLDRSTPQGSREIRGRLRSALAAIKHPTRPDVKSARSALDADRRAVEQRGKERVDAIHATPERIAGLPPKHGPLPKPDPGPIPGRMQAVRTLMGKSLPPAFMPPLTPSPRGTIPDLNQPVLTDDEIRIVSLGEVGIMSMVTETDPEGAEARAKLRAVRDSLGKATENAPAPAGVSPGPIATIPGAPVLDEDVVSVALSPADRELFASVSGRLRADTAAEAEAILAAVRREHSGFPGGVLQTAFKRPLGEDLEPVLERKVTAAADELAAAIDLAPAEIEAAIAARQAEVALLKQQAEVERLVALGDAQAAAAEMDALVQAAAKMMAETTVRAVEEDRAQAQPVSDTQARVERAIAELETPVTLELARLDNQQRLRERAIADAVRAQVSAIGLARVRDELALGTATPEAQEQAAEVGRWADAAIAQLRDGDQSVEALRIADARSDTERLKAELREAAREALKDLRAWGANHAQATDAWWIALDAKLQRWADDATARAELWKDEQAQASRLALAQDLQSFTTLWALEEAGDREAAAAYRASLDRRAHAVVSVLQRSFEAGSPDPAGALVAGIRERILAHERAWLEDGLTSRVRMLEPRVDDETWQSLIVVANALQPGWNVETTATNLHAATSRWRGHDEQQIFDTLMELTPLGRKLLERYYRHRYGTTLTAALEGRGNYDADRLEGPWGSLDKAELETAGHILAGDRVKGAVGAINSAITGPGVAIDSVNRILRALSAEDRRDVVKGYEARFGRTLEVDLRAEWKLASAQIEETLAIASNDLARASAIALGQAVRTRTTGDESGQSDQIAEIDRDKAAAVYAQIRSDVQAEAARQNWTTARLNAEITLRNRELERRFDEQARDQWWAKEANTGATRAAFALASGPVRDELAGLADNDMVKADVARLRREETGLVAEDTAINAVYREQAERSAADAKRDLEPILSARREKQMRTAASSGIPLDELKQRMRLEHADAKEVDAHADTLTGGRMDALDAAHKEKTGRTLLEMSDANMWGAAWKEAETRIKNRGALNAYEKIRFAIEGLGTDKSLESTLAGMTHSELLAADFFWRRDHHGQSLKSAIWFDTSGREEDDLIELATFGKPETPEEVAAAARRKFKRDRKSDTLDGRRLTAPEIERARVHVEQLEAQLEALKVPKLTPDERERAMRSFEVKAQYANAAIDQQRQALDAVTDAYANAAAITATLVVGSLLAPVSGGGSALVAVAVISSIIGTSVSIAVKTAMKGSAYGGGEVATDLAVGVVDAVVAGLTAGLGNALLGRGATTFAGMGDSRLYQLLSRMGTVGRAAAARQKAITLALSRFGGQGLLVRGLEKRALSAGVSEADSAVLRWIQDKSAEAIESAIQALPSSFLAALADEEITRRQGGAGRLLTNTLDATGQSTLMSLAVGTAHGAVVSGAHGTFKGLRDVARGAQVMFPGEIRMPTGDVLTHGGTPRERLAEFKRWQHQNAGGTMLEFTAERRAKLIANLETAERGPRTRELRKELLADLPKQQHQRFADVPIRSVSDAEFARLSGRKDGDAHLLIGDGQAMILVRDGAPATAVRALLPQVRERVLSHSGGRTVESALPEGLRDTPIRIDANLPGDEIRVKPILGEGGRITGVEVLAGPDAHPIDIALHAGEISRIRRWTGLLGTVRLALADFGKSVGLEFDSPRDPARFEAAGELDKLGPILEERMRRLMKERDWNKKIDITMQALDLETQIQRAHSIATGKLVVEPRGYVAMATTKKPPLDASSETKKAATPDDVTQRRITPVRDWLPTGKGGDLSKSSRRALATEKLDVVTVDIVTAAGRDHAYYGYDPHTFHYFVDLPTPDGKRLRRAFSSLDDYHNWQAARTGPAAVESLAPKPKKELTDKQREKLLRAGLDKRAADAADAAAQPPLTEDEELAQLIAEQAREMLDADDPLPIIKNVPPPPVSPEKAGVLRSALTARMKAAETWPSRNGKWLKTGWNAHHLIPVEFLYHDVFQVLRRTIGWDHNAAKNGMALPTSLDVRGVDVYPVHQVTAAYIEAKRGSRPSPQTIKDLQSHPIYSERVKRRLDAIAKEMLVPDGSRMAPGKTPAELSAKLDSLLLDLRGEILSGKSDVLW